MYIAYVGKRVDNKILEICRVIDNDITTDFITVFNRNTEKIEILRRGRCESLWPASRRMARIAEGDFTPAYRRAVLEYKLNKPNVWENIVDYMDDEIRERLHIALAPCSEIAFLKAYLDEEPSFKEILWNEFGIELE